MKILPIMNNRQKLMQNSLKNLLNFFLKEIKIKTSLYKIFYKKAKFSNKQIFTLGKMKATEFKKAFQ